MRRLALAAVVLIALTGCAPGPVDAKTAANFEALGQLDGVLDVYDGTFGRVVVTVSDTPRADDVVAIIERFGELEWPGEFESTLSVSATNPAAEDDSFLPAGLDADLVEHELELWTALREDTLHVSLSYSDGGRSVNGDLPDETTLGSTIGILRDFRALDYGSLETSWLLTQYGDQGHELGSFVGSALPSDAALSALSEADELLDVTEFSISTDDGLEVMLSTPNPGGLDPDDLSAMRDTAVWPQAVATTKVFAALTEPFELTFAADEVSAYAQVYSCDGEPDEGNPLSPELQALVSCVA